MDDSTEEAKAAPVTIGSCKPAIRSGGRGAHLSAADGLIQLSRLVQGLFGRVSERHNLTPVQAKLLCVLAGGPRRMADLAGCFGVEKAALTGLVDRAERNGLVARSSVPGDRRALYVSLTEAGQRAARAFHADATRELDRLVLPLAPGDRKQFRTSMQKVIAAVEEATL